MYYNLSSCAKLFVVKIVLPLCCHLCV